jgi:hypothetical protein
VEVNVMRKIAGVLLIVAACLNLAASMGYLLGGAFTAGVSMGADNLGDEIAGEWATQEGQTVSPAFSDGMDQVAGAGMAAGSALVFFGVFLLAAFGVLIAGAVFLFKGVRPRFVIAAAVVALLAEAGGIWFGQFGVTNVVGLVGGVLALLAAKQLLAQNQAEPAESPVETALEAKEDLSVEPEGSFGVPAPAEGSMQLAAEAPPVGLDAVEKNLIAVMIVGMLLMAGSSAWYYLG